MKNTREWWLMALAVCPFIAGLDVAVSGHSFQQHLIGALIAVAGFGLWAWAAYRFWVRVVVPTEREAKRQSASASRHAGRHIG